MKVVRAFPTREAADEALRKIKVELGLRDSLDWQRLEWQVKSTNLVYQEHVNELTEAELVQWQDFIGIHGLSSEPDDIEGQLRKITLLLEDIITLLKNRR